MPRPGVPLTTATKTGKQAAARKRQPSKKDVHLLEINMMNQQKRERHPRS
jgi:hypothetical protein